MSNGQLYRLRQDWRRHCSNLAINPACEFVEKYGATATYLHIGIDSEKNARGRVYHATPYAVFEVSGGSRVAFSLTEIEALGHFSQNHDSAEIRARMAAQLKMVVKDLDVNMPLIREKAAGAYQVIARHNRLAG